MSGCAIIEQPKNHIIADFTHYSKQPDGITCGPACVDMVLRYFDILVPFSSIELNVLTTATFRGNTIGFSTPKGVAYGLCQNGVSCKITRGNVYYLKSLVCSGIPPIVLLRSDSDMWHWVVVIGYDREFIIIADPFTGKMEKIKISAFESSWAFSGNMDGGKVGKICPWCGGSGVKFYLLCDLCFGYGRIDPYNYAIKSAGINSYTIIVPTYAKKRL